MLEGGKGGLVFKHINSNEIKNKYSGKGKSIPLQKHINKMHIDYIATRKGTVIDENVNHGLFGNAYEDNGSLLDFENMTMQEINKFVGERSKKNIDFFKTVFSLTEEDTIRYGMTKDAWEDAIAKRITDIAKISNIPTGSIEWCASVHIKEDHPHCHFVFWNKDQDLSLRKKPFIDYKKIRGAISKEVYKEELEKLYNTKNISKKEIKNMSKEELSNYKDKVKNELKRQDLEFDIVDTFEEEKLIKKISDKLKPNQKIYLYDKANPENFVEIYKDVEVLTRKYYGNVIDEKKEILKFKNNGDRALLYKNDDFTDTGCFLTNFNEIKVANTKEELEKIIKEQKDKDVKIDNELREIMPSLVPNNILSYEFREKSFLDITNRIVNLKTFIKNENIKAGLGEKITFRYDLQQSSVKNEIDRITTLILNTSKDCKLQFNEYISSSLDIARYLSDINNKNDYERVKIKAKDEAFNRIGNQILQFLKEEMVEINKEEYEQKKLKYEEQKAEYEEKKEEYETKQKEYEEMTKMNNARTLINNIFNNLDTENISMNAKRLRLRENFANMTKEQRIAKLKEKQNSNGFNWFLEE